MKTNVQLAASVEFLNTNLVGALQSVDDNKIFLVKQLKEDKKETGIKLASLAKSLKDIVGGTQISLPDEIKGVADKYEIQLNQVYLKIEQPKTGDKSVEYALWISIATDEKGLNELKEANPIFKLVALKEISLKIWSTENQKILEEMSFVDIKKQLSLT